MKVKFILNEIKMEQVVKRLDSKKLRDLIWNYYENSSLKVQKMFKKKVNEIFTSLEWQDSSYTQIKDRYKYFIYSDLCFKNIISALKSLDMEERNLPICLNWYISKLLIPALKGIYITSLPHILGLIHDLKYNTFQDFEKFFQFQRFIEPPEKKDLMNIDGDFELNSIIYSARKKQIEWVEKNKYKQLKDKAEYRKIHEDDEFSIYIPDNQEAACLLGMGTKWCTAALTSKNYYKDYHNKWHPLIILISKSNPNEKYQFHFETKQFMDQDDQGMNREKLSYLVNNYFDIFMKYCNDFYSYIKNNWNDLTKLINSKNDSVPPKTIFYNNLNYHWVDGWVDYSLYICYDNYLPESIYDFLKESLAFRDRLEKQWSIRTASRKYEE